MGVNGYAFIVNNNGYVLTHPDLRPEVCLLQNRNFNKKCSINKIDNNYGGIVSGYSETGIQYH